MWMSLSPSEYWGLSRNKRNDANANRVDCQREYLQIEAWTRTQQREADPSAIATLRHVRQKVLTHAEV